MRDRFSLLFLKHVNNELNYQKQRIKFYFCFNLVTMSIALSLALLHQRYLLLQNKDRFCKFR
jgi:hypothetical protein